MPRAPNKVMRSGSPSRGFRSQWPGNVPRKRLSISSSRSAGRSLRSSSRSCGSTTRGGKTEMPDKDPLERLRQLTEPGMLLDPDLLARILEALPDAVIVVDRDGIMRFVNAQAELIFGYPRQTLLGESVDLLLPDERRLPHAEHRRSFFLEPRSRPMGSGSPLQGKRQDGTLITVDINLSPVVSLHGVYAVAVIRPR